MITLTFNDTHKTHAANRGYSPIFGKSTARLPSCRAANASNRKALHILGLFLSQFPYSGMEMGKQAEKRLYNFNIRDGDAKCDFPTTVLKY
jgi:hypothetical protein